MMDDKNEINSARAQKQRQTIIKISKKFMMIFYFYFYRIFVNLISSVYPQDTVIMINFQLFCTRIGKILLIC